MTFLIWKLVASALLIITVLEKPEYIFSSLQNRQYAKDLIVCAVKNGEKMRNPYQFLKITL